MESIRQKAVAHQKQLNSPQVALFTSKADNPHPQDILPEAKEFQKSDLLSFEKQLLGFYLTDHPLAEAMKEMKNLSSHQISDLDPHVHLNQTITIGGMIKRVKKVITKKSRQEMVFATLDDETGNLDLVVFPKIYQNTKNLWINDQPVLVIGKVDSKEDRLGLIVETAIQPGTSELAQSASKSSKASQIIKLLIKQTSPKSDLVKINQLFQANPGNDKVIIQLQNGLSSKIIPLPYAVNFSSIKKQITTILKKHQGKIVKTD